MTTTGLNVTFAYDFRTSDGLTYEVKADKASQKYPNFFIEFLQNGKPSGIRTTEANYYIITDTEKHYLISVDAIKQIIQDQRAKNKLSIKNFTNKAGGTTNGYAIKKTIIINKSILI